MAISIFPSTAAEFVSNNFVIDMNDSTNNTADTGGIKQAGPYSMSFSSGDSSFDVYLIDDEGNSVGYSNGTSITASGLFSTVVILGVAQDEIISFTYQGSVNNADGEGDEPGAGAYLESISPSDLPSIDDTATVTGGNFGADTEITFESGATVLPAKSITVVSGTELLVTRPDGLIEDDSPYTLRAVTTGVPEPTGTNSNILTDAVTAGSDPTWVTTSPLATGTVGVAYTETLEATDSDGTVVDYSVTAGSLPTGLSLDSSTGVISGTPTAGGQTFTATASDDGGNTSTREFNLPVQITLGGAITFDNTFTYHTFTASDDFEALVDISNVEYFVIAGGGGAGAAALTGGGGGGGAGGLLQGTASTITSGTYSVTVGAGGNGAASNGSDGSNGSNSTFGAFGTGIGGGGGGNSLSRGLDGGSGGGAGRGGGDSGGNGTSGQGFDGGTEANNRAAGGGGAGEPGSSSVGGDGLLLSTVATATSTGVDGGYYAGGGAGGQLATNPQIIFSGGLGGGGDTGQNGETNTGGGAGGGGNAPAANGGSGIVIVRYAS